MAFDRQKHDVAMMLSVLKGASIIYAHGGHGRLQLDFRKSQLVSCRTTVRDHLPKEARMQDSHQRSEEGGDVTDDSDVTEASTL